MNKILALVILALTPALSAAHEGHIEGLVSSALHSFSMTEVVLASSSAFIWALTHKKESSIRRAGAIIALAMLGLSIGV